MPAAVGPITAVFVPAFTFVATAEPVFAGVIAYLAFGDKLQPLQLVGAAIIIAGIITVQTATSEPVMATAPLQ